MKKAEDRSCFVCQTSLKGKPKVLSYYAYRQNYKIPLDERQALCSDCARKDLEIAHANAVKPVVKYKKILGKLVWLK